MKLSLLTFSVIGEVSAGTMDAALLAKLAADNGISELDMFGGEIAAYGEDALREAMEKSGVRCGCVIANVSLLDGAGERRC